MRRTVISMVVAALLGCGCGSENALITVSLDRPVNLIRPDRALGAGLDGQQMGDMAGVYTARNLTAMRSAGFPSVTYRLRTELGSEAWHPIPSGSFSGGAQGYWTSASRPGRSFAVSNGYRLPRRGNTIDQANNDGYSRLVDGDPRSFWKSDPYLDRHFTHERHDAWVMVDLGRVRPVDSVQIAWAAPYATRYRVQYWVGDLPPSPYGREREDALFARSGSKGDWHDFAAGRRAGRGGTQRVRVASTPGEVRYVRILLTESSHTASAGARDLRDRLGYAIREIAVGQARGQRLVDWVRHGRTNALQSIVWVSSTDPWHRRADRNPNTEQPSFDRVFASGLTRGRPVLMPVSMLYGNPQDAVAQLRYLRARHYMVDQVELGEEPDGQLMTPEDYGALYLQFAQALHAVDPHLKLGGPGFSTALPDWSAWPDRTGERSFMARFLRYLRGHGATRELGFFSFEWYPVDNVCGDPATELRRAPGLLASILARQRRAGLPPGVPAVITEFGYSAFAAQPEVDLPGALSNADTIGRFLALGGKQAYLYGFEPQNVMQESRFCKTVGNLTLFKADDNHRLQYPLATYWAARLLNEQWVAPGDRIHRVLRTSSDEPSVSSYALMRPDGRLSLLLLNRDAHQSHTVSLSTRLRCPLDVFRLSPAEYAWHASGAYPKPDGPPRHLLAKGDRLALGPYSLSVARTHLPLRSCT